MRDGKAKMEIFFLKNQVMWKIIYEITSSTLLKKMSKLFFLFHFFTNKLFQHLEIVNELNLIFCIWKTIINIFLPGNLFLYLFIYIF